MITSPQDVSNAKMPGAEAIPLARVLIKRKKKHHRIGLINTTSTRYDLVRYTSHKFGMRESSDNWNVYWTDLSISVQRCKDMKPFQRINHFPGMLEICRKDLLGRNMNRFLKMFPADYNIFPKTWCLPSDVSEIAEYAKLHRSKCFIVKPDLGCQGKGISLVKNVNQLKTYDKMICQLYVQRPFLIDGFKFDLRIYALITSCDPLRIFVYNEGLARFATTKYKEPNSVNAKNMYMHLTNYSVNKHSKSYIVDSIDGSKRKISTINAWFLKNNYDVPKIWESIDDVIVKTILVCLPTLKHYYYTCFPNHKKSHACFELLGLDFMFDYRLKPYVLEVNHSPSFHTDETIDREVKESLLYDTFNILNLSQNNRLKIMNANKSLIKDRLLGLTDEASRKEDLRDEFIIKSRIDWENTHLGNYRKIFPGLKDAYYEQFVNVKRNALLAENMSSKEGKLQGEQINKTKKWKTGRIVKNLEKTKLRAQIKMDLSKFEPSIIDEQEERERMFTMTKREFLMRSHGILEKVYRNLKKAGVLRLEDDLKFRRNYEMIVRGKMGLLQRDKRENLYKCVKSLDAFGQGNNVQLVLPEKSKSSSAINVSQYEAESKRDDVTRREGQPIMARRCYSTFNVPKIPINIKYS